jgi:hypothetical protein
MAKINKGKVTFEKAEAQFGYIKGECKWAKVLEVDDYGNYSISMYGDEVVGLQQDLEELRDLAASEIAELGKPYEVADIFKVDSDGNKFLGFKLPEKDYEGNDNSIKMYDAGGNLVTDWDKLVGNGSKVKIKYRVAPYYMSSTKMVGLSFKFYAVQVINLVEFKQGDKGFGDETDEAPFATDTTPDSDF